MSVTESSITVEDDDFEARVPSQSIRKSVSLPFSPRKMMSRISRKPVPVPYDQIPQKPLRLTVLKLDGSSFGNCFLFLWLFLGEIQDLYQILQFEVHLATAM